jgi:transglycosylase-like protein
MNPRGRPSKRLGSGRRPRWPRAVGVAALLAASLAASGLADAQTAQERFEESKRRAADTASELGPLLEQYEAIRADYLSAREDLRSAERTARHVARRLIDVRKAAIETARKLYEAGPHPDLQMLVSIKKLTHFEGRITYIESAHEAYLEIFERLRVEKKAFTEKLEDLQKRHAAIERSYDDIAAIKRALEARLGQDQAEVAKFRDAVADQQKAAAVVELPSPEPLPPQPNPNGWHANWDAIAECESGGNWHLDSTYDGGLQFSPDTWIAFGGGRYASYAWQASRLEQIAIAEKVLASQGPGAWPNCFVPA